MVTHCAYCTVNTAGQHSPGCPCASLGAATVAEDAGYLRALLAAHAAELKQVRADLTAAKSRVARLEGVVEALAAHEGEVWPPAVRAAYAEYLAALDTETPPTDLEPHTYVLSEEGSRDFAERLASPPEPTEALRGLMADTTPPTEEVVSSCEDCGCDVTVAADDDPGMTVLCGNCWRARRTPPTEED